MINVIKRKFSRKEHRRGYTLVELLTVIAIIAIVAVIAIPSALYISDSLKFKENNDYAKTIYMAAQTNLSEMRADGRIAELQVPDNNGIEAKMIPVDDNAGFPVEHWSAEYMYCVSGTPAYDLVLPKGIVEDVLRENQVLIEYNPYTANVYAVFYSDGGETLSYSNVARDEETRKELELGYYCGTGLSSSIMEIVDSKINVSYKNEEEGIIEVKVPIPEEFYEMPADFKNLITAKIEISGESMKKPVYDRNGNVSEVADTTIKSNYIDDVVLSGKDSGEIVDGRYVVFNYTIDKLLSGQSFADRCQTKGDKVSDAGSENDFKILPGQNIKVRADVDIDEENSPILIEGNITGDVEYGINPLFEYMIESSTAPGRYVIAVSNGRNLQNLNAVAPTIANKVETVLITDDIDWDETVQHYSGQISADTSDAPLCDLPYFVPINNEGLFGTAKFVYPNISSVSDLIEAILGALENALLGSGGNKNLVPTLSDEVDARIDPMTSWKDNKNKENGKTYAENHARITGINGGKKISGININSAKYASLQKDKKIATKYYVGEVDYTFTGLFGYVNTTITDVSLVNPVVKGVSFGYKDSGNFYSNPATGALVGCAGYNTLLSGCSVYIDRNASAFSAGKMVEVVPEYAKDASNQSWYGVSGEGAVGGLVGYAKSHRTTEGTINSADAPYLAFINCFAAVPVSGNMRGHYNAQKAVKNFGYSNGVGGLVGNSELTNFYNCYSSGNVLGNGAYIVKKGDGFFGWVQNIFGVTSDIFLSGRESMGVGGFVGTSHGTKYSNCFATGNVDGSNLNSDPKATVGGSDGLLGSLLDWVLGVEKKEYDFRDFGSGGFVGFMSYDETKQYGNDTDSTKIAQNTVFTDCYSVGRATINKGDKAGTAALENFAGGVGRIRLTLGEATYFMGDYYELYAPLVVKENRVPNYANDYYIFRHSYYLSNYYLDISEEGRDNTRMCSKGQNYDVLAALHTNHRNADWIEGEIEKIKDLPTTTNGKYYRDQYFSTGRGAGMTDTYRSLYREGFSEDNWTTATAANTHAYNVEMAGQPYPFSMIKGLPYYGNWPEAPVSAGLAYYETYEDDRTVYFPLNGENIEVPVGTVVKDDGYVIFIANDKAADEANHRNITVTTGTYTWNLTAEKDSILAPVQSYAYSFNIFKIPKEYLTITPAEGEFYSEVKVVSGNNTYILYFNPDGAMTQINPPDYNAIPDPADPAHKLIIKAVKPDLPKTVLIRSARHFANLPEMSSVLGNEVTYIQQLSIDSAKYGTALDKTVTVDSLSGTYTGSGGYVSQAEIRGFVPESGAFFKDVSGTVRDLKIVPGDMNVNGTENAAVLAAVSSGVIENVDIIAEKANLHVTATENAGVLVGKNDGGKIDGCTVQVWSAELTAKNTGVIAGASNGKAATDTETAKNADIRNIEVILGNFNAAGSEYAGAIIGKSENTTVKNPKITITDFTAAGAVSGGIGGYMKNGTVTGNTVTVANVKGASVFGGLAGDVLNVTFGNSTVKLTSVTADTAVGGVGMGSAVSVKNARIEIGSVSGKTSAAGFAGNLLSGNIESISGVSVYIKDGIRSTEGNAAGFADRMNGSVTACKVYFEKSEDKTPEISGKNAAGFVAVSTATINDCAVTGKGKITAVDNAAGFVVTAESDSIYGCIVTPVYGNKTSSYIDNSYANLTISGKTAAGFAVTSLANIKNSAAVATVSGTENVAGFIHTNKGPVEKCQANTVVNGSAFIERNEHTVYNSYAWYQGTWAIPDNRSEGESRYIGCFFAPVIRDVSAADIKVTVFPGEGYNGSVNDMTLDMLTATVLNGKGAEFDEEGNLTSYIAWEMDEYNAYPFDRELGNSAYGYPMIGHHYGDWASMPRYAHGLVYFEEMEDGTINLELRDISNKADEPNIHGGDISFNNVCYKANSGELVYRDGVIKNAGYAIFCVNPEQIEGVYAGEELKENKLNFTGLDTKLITADEFKKKYNLYMLDSTDTNPVEVRSADGSAYITCVPAYARTIGDTDGQYDIRTPEQFSRIIGDYSFDLRHNLDLKTTVSEVKNFYGHGRTIATDRALFGSVTGEVNGITVNANGISTSLFGNVHAGASVNTVHVNVAGTKTFTNSSAVLVSQNNGTVTGCQVFKGSSQNQTPAEITVQGAVFGGLVGTNSSTGKITDSTANVKITYSGTSAAEIGGLVGKNEGAVNGTATATITSSTGSLSIGGLVGANSGTVGGTATATITSSASGLNAGGLVGTNEGTVGGKANAVITYNGQSGNVGGAIGTNSGTVSGATTTVTYSGNSKNATVGGLVGKMDGGSVASSSSAGDITGVSGIIAGGAIGAEADTDSAKSYSGVTSTLHVDPAVKGSRNNANDSTANAGKVGTFIGYVRNGQFANCSTTDNRNTTFHFLGEISVKAKYDVAAGSYESSKGGKDTVKIEETSMGAYNDKLAENGLSVTEDSAVYDYYASITGCKFQINRGEKNISINPKHYYSAEETHEEKQEGDYLKETRETTTRIEKAWESVTKKYSEIAGNGTERNPTEWDNLYYKYNNQYYKVRGWIESTWTRTYYYIQYYRDGRWRDIVNGETRNSNITLYHEVEREVEETKVIQPTVEKNKEYILLAKDSSGNLYSLNLDANGNPVANQIKNGDLSTAHFWKWIVVEERDRWGRVTATYDTWECSGTGSDKNKLRLYYKSSWSLLGGTKITIEVTGEDNYDISVDFKGNDSQSMGAFNFENEDGYYLTFDSRNKKFTVDDSPGNIFLYGVTEIINIHIGTFTPSVSGSKLTVS